MKGAKNKPLDSERGARVGQKRHETRPLDRLTENPLFSSRGGESLSGVDLPVGSHHPTKHLDILVVDIKTAIGSGLHLELWAGSMKLGHCKITSRKVQFWKALMGFRQARAGRQPSGREYPERVDMAIRRRLSPRSLGLR